MAPAASPQALEMDGKARTACASQLALNICSARNIHAGTLRQRRFGGRSGRVVMAESGLQRTSCRDFARVLHELYASLRSRSGSPKIVPREASKRDTHGRSHTCRRKCEDLREFSVAHFARAQPSRYEAFARAGVRRGGECTHQFDDPLTDDALTPEPGFECERRRTSRVAPGRCRKPRQFASGTFG